MNAPPLHAQSMKHRPPAPLPLPKRPHSNYSPDPVIGSNLSRNSLPLPPRQQPSASAGHLMFKPLPRPPCKPKPTRPLTVGTFPTSSSESSSQATPSQGFDEVLNQLGGVKLHFPGKKGKTFLDPCLTEQTRKNNLCHQISSQLSSCPWKFSLKLSSFSFVTHSIFLNIVHPFSFLHHEYLFTLSTLTKLYCDFSPYTMTQFLPTNLLPVDCAAVHSLPHVSYNLFQFVPVVMQITLLTFSGSASSSTPSSREKVIR